VRNFNATQTHAHRHRHAHWHTLLKVVRPAAALLFSILHHWQFPSSLHLSLKLLPACLGYTHLRTSLSTGKSVVPVACQRDSDVLKRRAAIFPITALQSIKTLTLPRAQYNRRHNGVRTGTLSRLNLKDQLCGLPDCAACTAARSLSDVAKATAPPQLTFLSEAYPIAPPMGRSTVMVHSG
jgi:hypothetical protein